MFHLVHSCQESLLRVQASIQFQIQAFGVEGSENGGRHSSNEKVFSVGYLT